MPETEITGPLAARLFVSSSTADADLFVVFRVFTPDLREVVFMGAIDPHTPVAQGWLRASHRRLDAKLSTAWRPYHTHDERQPLRPGEIVALDIELWPTSIVVPAGHRLALTVRGRDYEFAKSTGARLSNFKNELKGCGPFPARRSARSPESAVRRTHDAAHRAAALRTMTESIPAVRTPKAGLGMRPDLLLGSLESS